MTQIKILPKVLIQIRNLRRLTQEALAKKAHINEQTIYRLESGRVAAVRQKTADGLSNALGVRVEVLTGESPFSDDDGVESSSWIDNSHQLNTRVHGAIVNAFRLVSLRYGVPTNRIVELAPLLFTIAAEKSLQRRRANLNQLIEALASIESFREKFPYLPATITPTFEADDAVAAEENSIDKRDIFGSLIESDASIFNRFGPVKKNFDFGRDNPFSLFLSDEAASFSDHVNLTSFDGQEDAGYTVCNADALSFCGGDKDIAQAILSGLVVLKDMPRELLRDDPLGSVADQQKKRLEWLRARTAEAKVEQKKRAQELWRSLTGESLDD